MAGAKIDLARDFRDLLHAFVAREVRFLVVGAYALAVHGRPRATGDLDLWVEPTRDNAARAYDALREFGAPLHDLTPEDLATAGVVFQIGVEPMRIDILTQISGVGFADAWPRRPDRKQARHGATAGPRRPRASRGEAARRGLRRGC
jgi:hypothetical protein